MSMFKPAVKEAAKLRLAIAGPSGSGKTYTALAVASELSAGGKVALVDTEHGSASKYADLFGFDVAEMHPPFHPDKFVAAITEAAAAGYAVIILDSLTHAWNGSGGMLEIVDDIAKRKSSGNTYAAWKDATPIQNRLIDAIVGAPIHVIATMRSKQDYAQDKDERGRTVIRKVGMAPQQRDGFEYEFDVFIDMSIDHEGIVSKTRCPALTDRVFAKPGRDMAAILAEWLKGAPAQVTARVVSVEAPAQAHAPQEAPAATNGNGKPKVSDGTLRRLHAVGVEYYGGEWDSNRHRLVDAITTGAATSSKDLTEAEAQKLISGLEKKLHDRQRVTEDNPFADEPVTA